MSSHLGQDMSATVWLVQGTELAYEAETYCRDMRKPFSPVPIPILALKYVIGAANRFNVGIPELYCAPETRMSTSILPPNRADHPIVEESPCVGRSRRIIGSWSPRSEPVKRYWSLQYADTVLLAPTNENRTVWSPLPVPYCQLYQVANQRSAKTPNNGYYPRPRSMYRLNFSAFWSSELRIVSERPRSSPSRVNVTASAGRILW